MHYCLVICGVSSTDKFDRLTTRGKFIDNNTQLFIFISILIMTQLHPRDPENRQQNQFSERRFSEKKKPVTTGRMRKRGLSAYNAQFVSVDLIGEKNQVILEFCINSHNHRDAKIKSSPIILYMRIIQQNKLLCIYIQYGSLTKIRSHKIEVFYNT